jgi:hypothetical protein
MDNLRFKLLNLAPVKILALAKALPLVYTDAVNAFLHARV